MSAPAVRSRLAIAFVGVLLLGAMGALADIAPEAPFLAEIRAAMLKMHADMSVRASGDIDVDFVALMIPHHQGAIDMARVQLRYGHNEQLRRIAQEIIIEQQQEITAMHLALGEPAPASLAAPDQAPVTAPAQSRKP